MRSQFDRKNFTRRQVKVESLRRYDESRAKQQQAVLGERTLTPWYDEKKSKKRAFNFDCKPRQKRCQAKFTTKQNATQILGEGRGLEICVRRPFPRPAVKA